MSTTGHSSDEEEEEEPILKYSRFEGAISKILVDDSVSAFVICASIIVLGSHNGLIYILDPSGSEIRRYRAHTAAISAVSIDKTGSVVATASIDGRLVIYNISKKETNMFDFKRPLRTVSIDPDFVQNGKGRVISGGLAGRLILSERGWVGNKETVISDNEGPIISTAWHGNLLAWSNDLGVRVYDLLNMRMVGRVDRRPESPRADLFKCRLLWQNNESLIVGWFDHITKIIVQEGVGQVLNLDTTYTMRLDSVVSGLAQFGDSLLVMAYITDLQEIQSPTKPRTTAERPEIRIINSSFEEISEDAIGLRGFEKLQPNDYDLHTHPNGKSFLIISPKDIVSACERDIEDHLKWLLDMGRFEEALQSSKKEKSLPFELSHGEVGRRYMQHLHDQGDYGKAARLTPEVLVEDAEAWEKLIFMYAEKGHLTDISPYIPVEHPTLSSVVYEMTLGRYLNADEQMLLSTIRKWPVEIYNVDDIINAVEHKLARSKDDNVLKDCLAELFLKTDRPRDALPYYIALSKPETFNLIKQYHLFDAVQDNVRALVLLDAPVASADVAVTSLANQEAIDLLVHHSHSIPMHKVVSQLEDRPALLYCYFRALLDYDHHLGAAYSDLQISLYAEYDREKLLELLKSTSAYSLENAAKICEQRDYIPELVFILGKTGNNKKALKLIIEKLGDVQQAIDFAYTQADSELWEDLITYSLDKPKFIRGLLEHAGTAIDPISLIRRIPANLVIEGIKGSLSKIFNDFDLQMSLSSCGNDIHKSQVSDLSTRLLAGQRRGIVVSPVADVDADLFVLFDGRVVRKDVALGDDHAAAGTPSQVKDEYRHGRGRGRPGGGGRAGGKRQSTAAKITESAVFKTRLMTHLESTA